MADTTKFYTRVQLKYDTWSNWHAIENSFRPLPGEVCIVEVPANTTGTASVTPPSILMKVGRVDPDNNSQNMLFKDLDWLSAKAADVHAWAKLDATKFVNWLNGETVEGMTACPVTFATDTELESVSAALSSLDATVKTIQGDLGTAQNDIADLKKTDTSHGNRLTALEAAVGTNGDGDSLSTRVGALETTMAAEQTNIDNLEAAMAIVRGTDSVEGSIAKALKDAKAYSDEKDTAQTTALQGYANGKAEAALTSAKSYTDQRETAIKALYEAADDAINAKINGLGLEYKENGDQKTIRTIANEELAAQLLSGKADADFKTLQELAAWLEDHPEDAAAMSADILAITKEIYGTSATDASEFTGNSRIDLLETNLTNEISARENAVKGVQDQIDELAGDGKGSVSDQITEAINTARTEWEQDIVDANTAQDTILKKYADDTVDAEAVARASAVAGVQSQIKTLVGSENGTLTDSSVIGAKIAAAKQEAINTAAGDATTKAGTAKTEAVAAAKEYTDDEIAELSASLSNTNALIAGRVTTLEEAVEDLTKDSVDSRISAAEGRAATDATTKANSALTDAKAYTNQREAAIKQAYEAADTAIKGRLDVIESADVTKEGSIAHAVNVEKLRAEGAETALGNRIKANEDKLAGISEATVAAHVAAAVKTETDNRISADEAIDGRLDIIESKDVTVVGSIAKAVNDEKVRAEGAELALSNRATALETAVGASTDAAKADGSLYARTAQNAADIATLDSDLDSVAARPFVKVATNSKAQYVVFYCGSAKEMIENDLTLVEP